MAGWGSDSSIFCGAEESLWDGDQDQAYVQVVCRLPRDHDNGLHYDPKLDLTWPQETKVGA